jgi:hypothetical protein
MLQLKFFEKDLWKVNKGQVMFEDREIPEKLPEIKYIDISNEDYMKVQSLFSLQPERLNPEDASNSVCDSLNTANK